MHWLWVLLAPLLASLVGLGVEQVMARDSVVIIYMTAVILVAVRTDVRRALICALLCVLALNIVFTEPRGSLWMHHRQDWLTIALFMIAALVTGRVAAQLREQLRARDLQDRLLAQERAEKERELLRSALLSSVSHDLRTPLASLLGAATSLRELDASLNGAQRLELLNTLCEEAERLDSYTQNLLDMTRLGRGQLSLDRDWVSPLDIVAVVVRRLRRRYPDCAIAVNAPQDMPLLWVHGALIEQALYNLLDNAVKCSVGREVRVALNTPESGQIVFTVEDSGPGIPESEWLSIFEMFHTLGRGDTYPTGTGLGLAISQGIAMAHGGRCYVVSSTLGAGSCIALRLPIDQGAPTA